MENHGGQRVPPIETRGARIRRLRKLRGLTQAELGKLVGVKELAAGDWEREKYAPSGENLVKLAEVLEVPPHYILYGEAGVYREAVEEIAAIVDRVRATRHPGSPAEAGEDPRGMHRQGLPPGNTNEGPS